MVRAAILIGLMLWLTPAARAQSARWAMLVDPTFDHLNQTQGLPQTLVTALAEDGSGFLWVGTQGGLARWDGYRFHNYKSDPKDPSTLPDNWITRLYTDAAGRLWVGTTADGLARYDSEKDIFVGYPGLSNGHVTAITDDGEGGLWIGTDAGLNRLAAGAAGISAVLRKGERGLPDDRITALARDRAGTLWVGTNSGLARRREGEQGFTPVSVPGPGRLAVRALFESGDGRLWIGTDGRGVLSLDPSDGPLLGAAEIAPGDAELRGQSVDVIEANGPNELWLGIHGDGIAVLDTATGQIHRIRHDQRMTTSLGHNSVRSLFRDRAGSLWIGSARGLDRYIDGHDAIQTVMAVNDPDGTLAGTDILTVLPSPDGKIWLGFGVSGVDVVDPASGHVDRLSGDSARPETALPRDSVFSLAAGSGGVYIGTARGVYRHDSSSGQLRRITVAGRDPVASTAALLTVGNTLWIGGREDGLWSLPLKGDEPAVVAPDNALLSDRRINSLIRGTDGTLWIGTLSGLMRFDPRARAVERIPADPADPSTLMPGFVSSMLIDSRGRLWVGILGGGICVLESADKPGERRFHRLNVADGLPSANIDKLLSDGRGRVWISTAVGLAVIDENTFAVQPLYRADGVAVGQYWSGSGAVTREGELIFGGAGGITIIHPDKLRKWSYHPPTVVTEARIGGKPTPAGRFLAGGDPAPLVLTPTANSLSVEFAALDYSQPERNHYAYRLKGFDHDWIDSDPTRRLATYTNLPPGNYTLKLRGSNRDGIFTEKDLDLPIVVQPAWYQTYWFYALLAISAAAVTLGIVQSRTAYLRRKRRDLERQVAERTAALVEKREQIASLLDNSGEGFLSFGADLVVDPDYSRACETLLGAAPAGRDAAELLLADDPKRAELLRRTVPKALEISDPLRRDVMLSLLPAEISCNGYQLEARYSVIENGHVMLVLRDVTQQRLLTDKVANERRRLEIIVAAVTDSRDFFDTIDSYRDFARELPDMLAKPEDPVILAREFYRQVHTFKGLLAQFSCVVSPQALQRLEDRLSGLDETVTREELAGIASSTPYETLLDQDLAPLRAALGDAFLERGEGATLSAPQIRLLQELVQGWRRDGLVDLKNPEIRALCDDIAHLRHVLLQDVLAGFDRVVRQVAERLEKEIEPLQVRGTPEIWLDPDRYGPFLRSLVHIFRNAVVHGIEDPERRLESGKSAAGSIDCLAETADGRIRLTISDDGAGLDRDALRRRIVDLGLVAADSAELSDRALADFVFRDAVSTEAEADDIAGRGIGLAAVRQEVTALGGQVTLVSDDGRGCRFLFELPLTV